MDQRWQDVRGRVERVLDEVQRGRRTVFGTDVLTTLWLPLTTDALAELEGMCGTRLPDAYRDYLTMVAAGGAGPGYGVFPALRDERGAWSWEGDGAELTSVVHLAEPFDPALTAQDQATLDAAAPTGDDAMEAWYDALDKVRWRDSRTYGALCLCHLGCAERVWLVVSGPHAGQVWRDERADGHDLTPVVDAQGRALDFADWYLAWLRDAETSPEG